MKKLEVRRIVQDNIEDVKRKLKLESWHILIEYGPARIGGDDTHYAGLCTTDPELFETALLTFDPKQLDSPAEVLDKLEHETAHCIGSHFDVCQAVLKRLLSKREYEAMDVLFHIAHEKVVASIQRILSSAGK